MTLESALAHMHVDRTTESVLKCVLQVFERHPGQWFDVDTLAGDARAAPAVVEPVLAALAEDFVLDFDGATGSYRYLSDALRDIEIKRYIDRVDAINDRLQDSVARFRQRRGTA